MPNLRISIIGTSCSGKTTLAKQLSSILNIPHIQLDEFNWLPNWKERPLEEFMQLIDNATLSESWICDGNYDKSRNLVWQRTTHIIWLNFPFHIVFRRALVRTIKRAWTKEELFSGNRESWQQSFFSKDSILLWVIQTHHKRKKKYNALLSKVEYQHLKVVQICNNSDWERCIAYFKKLVTED
jgi:adenylate kinase family enzyme